MKKTQWVIVYILISLLTAACSSQASPVERIPAAQRTAADWVLLGARQEVKNGTRYDASYVRLEYPGGDVPADRGACTDVVIRALRNADLDLQELIHEDMTAHFSVYTDYYGLSKPDANIDHRRIRNQMTFFERHGQVLTLEVEGFEDQWQWGDVVCWQYENGLMHTGIISDRTTPEGKPLVIHNGSIAREEDCLTSWPIVGHFRYPPGKS